MRSTIGVIGTTAVLAVAAGGCTGLADGLSGSREMSFFVTSVGTGRGGDLGGLEGADRHCQTLAAAAGAGGKAWRAYLSTQGATLADANVVNARDRIGPGPWYNAKGVQVARDVGHLHGANNLTRETALDERGQPVNGRTDKPNKHDILTGSRPDGTAFAGGQFPDTTCGNWTRGTTEGSAMVGHHDRAGPNDRYPWATSWNSAHPTLGCSMERIRPTGGDALFYCFAAK